MFRTWIVIAVATTAAAGTGIPEGWRSWSPRSEIAPRFSVDSKGGRRGGSALRIDGGQRTWKERRPDIAIP